MKKIFIIDDDATYIEMLERILIENGFATAKQSANEDVIESIKTEKPDLILLDIILPDASGLVILETLKKDLMTNQIPVFCLTNLPDEASRKKAIALGCASYLTKARTRLEDIPKHIEVYFRDEANKVAP